MCGLFRHHWLLQLYQCCLPCDWTHDLHLVFFLLESIWNRSWLKLDPPLASVLPRTQLAQVSAWTWTQMSWSLLQHWTLWCVWSTLYSLYCPRTTFLDRKRLSGPHVRTRVSFWIPYGVVLLLEGQRPAEFSWRLLKHTCLKVSSRGLEELH